MLEIRWESVIVCGVLAALAICVVAQIVLRVNAARAIEAISLACRDIPVEPNLYDLMVRRGADRGGGGSLVATPRAPHAPRAPRLYHNPNTPRWSRRTRGERTAGTSPKDSRSRA